MSQEKYCAKLLAIPIELFFFFFCIVLLIRPRLLSNIRHCLPTWGCTLLRGIKQLAPD